jgi:hypothetical protein
MNSATVDLYNCQFSPMACFSAVYIGSKSILGATVGAGLAGLAGVPLSAGVANVVMSGRGFIVAGGDEPLSSGFVIILMLIVGQRMSFDCTNMPQSNCALGGRLSDVRSTAHRIEIDNYLVPLPPERQSKVMAATA